MNRNFEDRKSRKPRIHSKGNKAIIKALNMYGRVPEQWELLEEIERLNNIINELEKELEERYLDFKDSECEEVRTVAYEDISILQKIKELKGSDKE